MSANDTVILPPANEFWTMSRVAREQEPTMRERIQAFLDSFVTK